MAIGQFFAGTPARVEQIQRFNPQQQSALQSLLGLGQQNIQNPYRGFEPIAQQARTQFQQNTVPTLAERFTSLGSNQISSPAFASQLGQQGAGLEQGLAALRSQYGMQNQAQGLQQLQQGLTPQMENIPLAAEGGALQELLPILAKLGVSGLGAYASGGWSALPGLLTSIFGA